NLPATTRTSPTGQRRLAASVREPGNCLACDRDEITRLACRNRRGRPRGGWSGFGKRPRCCCDSTRREEGRQGAAPIVPPNRTGGRPNGCGGGRAPGRYACSSSYPVSAPAESTFLRKPNAGLQLDRLSGPKLTLLIGA